MEVRNPLLVTSDAPPKSEKTLKLLRVETTAQIEVICTHEKPVFIKTHWVARRTRRCIPGDGLCPYCKPPVKPERWVGNLACVRVGHRSRGWLLQFTDDAFDRIRSDMGDRESLLGARIRVNRERDTIFSPLVLTLAGFTRDSLPNLVKGIEPTVMKMWSAKSRRPAAQKPVI